jgi:hypothetical protein
MEDYSKLTHEKLNQKLVLACQNDDLATVKHFLTSPNLKDKIYINHLDGAPLAAAVSGGHLEIVKYLLTSPELTKHANLSIKDEYIIDMVFKQEHLHILDFILNTPGLNLQYEHYCIQGVYKACDIDSVNLLDYLLNLPNSEPAYRTVNDGSVLHLVSMKGSLKVLNYLFTAPHLQEYVEKHADIEHGFNQAAFHKQIRVLEYFITDLNISKTQFIDMQIKQLPEKNRDYINKLFEIRELNNSLHSELNEKFEVNGKSKSSKKLKV